MEDVLKLIRATELYKNEIFQHEGDETTVICREDWSAFAAVTGVDDTDEYWKKVLSRVMDENKRRFVGYCIGDETRIFWKQF